jgi:hypothetical protein
MITAILVSTVPVIYAQNIMTTSVTNYTSIAEPSIAGLNISTIVKAINAKIKLIYGENSYNTSKPRK